MKSYIDFVQRYSVIILIVWLAFALISLPYLFSANKFFKIGGVTDAHVESTLAENLMRDKLPYGGTRIYVLYKSNTLKTTDPKFFAEVRKSLNGLKSFSLPYQLIEPYKNLRQIAADKKAVYVMIILKKPAEEAASWMPELHTKLGKPKSLEMYIGGDASFVEDIKEISRTDLLRAELIAIPISIIALVFVFGALVAGLVPIFSGFISVSIVIGIMYWLGHTLELSIFILNISTMLGLGLTLDYTLLIVNRFREELSHGQTSKEAMAISLATAGKSVFFSGVAVFISLSALLFFPVNVLYSIGIGGMIVVLIAITSALVFLPALLIILGKYVNAGSLIKKRSATATQESIWFKLSMGIMRRPLMIFFPTIIFLLMLGYPFLHVKINLVDPTMLPVWADSHQLVDQFKKEFNANELTPIFIVAEGKNKSILSPNNISSLYDFVSLLKKDSRVNYIDSIVSLDTKMKKKQYQHLYQLPFTSLSPPIKNFIKQSTVNQYTVMTVISQYPVNDQTTFDLVNTIRSAQIGNQITHQVTGISAFIMDTINSIYMRFFMLIGVVSVITYCVLLVLLRSVFLPLKAIIMNFLSLMVSYGMLVYIFQEGHFSHLLDFKMLGFTDMNLPIVLFFGLFGLSMDYEVFLLTRIKEFYEITGDNTRSIALGLEKSARVISSAALIIVLVAGAFVTADIIFVKAFGLGLALAIAVDASIIRILLVPATMRLMGSWNWYLPKWLDKILPNIKMSDYK